MPDLPTNPNWPALMSDRTAASYLDISRAQFWKWISIGKLPKAIPLAERLTRWRKVDIDAAIDRWAEGKGK